MISIVNQIFNNAENLPEKIAIFSGKKSYTYSQLKNSILKTKFYFENDLGIQKGDCIVIAADKNVEFIYSYLALHLIGAVAMPLASDTNEDRLSYIISQTKAKFAIGIKATEIQSVDFIKVESIDTIAEFEYPNQDALADILFTTGTTGNPKGVELTHKNICAAARNINEFILNSVEDVELVALPISHSFGLGRIRCSLSKGATIVLLGSFANLKRFYRFIEEKQVTGLAMVPSAWEYVKKMSGDKISDYQNQLKYIEYGSAFLPIEEKENLMKYLPNTRHCMHYGLTEASRSAFIEFHSTKNKLNTIGKASPNVEIKIFNENGAETPNGTIGELCVKGEHVLSKYYGMDSSESFYGDYFRTGDNGYVDEEGFVVLKGRLKETINVGGKKLSPIEVEEKINQIEGVQESVCVGVKDKEGILGEVVKAFVVRTDDSLAQEDILNVITPQLENYKLPREFEWIDEIPKTKSGKVQRLKLKENK